jgi:hypothetical protein
MAENIKLNNAEFHDQVEAAMRGLAEASDGVMGELKKAHKNQAALRADLTKLSSHHGVQEEVIALQQVLKATAGEGVN